MIISRISVYSWLSQYCDSRSDQSMALLSTPSVNTTEAVDQDRHGTRTRGLGQLVAAKDAICKLNGIQFAFQQESCDSESYVTTH